MNIAKLNAKGFSHDILIVVFVVLFGLIGCTYLVLTHADTCSPVSGATSSAVSTPASAPVSEPVSSSCPVSAPPTSSPVSAPTQTLAGTCSITVATDSRGKPSSATVKVNNVGKTAFIPSLTSSVTLISTNGTGLVYATTAQNLASLTRGASERSVIVKSDSAPLGSSTKQIAYNVSSSTPAFNCSKTVSVSASGTPAQTPIDR